MECARLGSGVKRVSNRLPPLGASYDKNIFSASFDVIGRVKNGYDIGHNNESQGPEMDLSKFIL